MAVYTEVSDEALRVATSRSFDRLDSDGCQSTNDTVLLPPESNKSDWEVELGIVIATRSPARTPRSARIVAKRALAASRSP